MENRKLELYYEPVNDIKDLVYNRVEMTGKELAFLCGLLKQCRPEKIVEIGVAAGGTTAVILNCISMLGLNSQLISLDLSENYYRDRSKQTGYIGEEYKKISDKKFQHTLYTGKYAVEYLETVGNNIDFLILDTVHSLPGELLDFLAYYPYLKMGSTVVLHDIALNHYSTNLEGFATKLLLDTVVAEKSFDIDSEKDSINIGAFKIIEDTGKYISDVFSALTITWKYSPEDTEVSLYRMAYEKYYSWENLRYFDMAVKLNRRTLNKRGLAKRDQFIKIFSHIEKLINKKVYVYGCGNYGRQFYRLLYDCGVDLKGYIISDGEKKAEIRDGEKIYWLSEVRFNRENDVIYLGVNRNLYKEICAELIKRGISEYILPDKTMFELITN